MKFKIMLLFLLTTYLSFSNIDLIKEYNLLWEDLKNYKTYGYKSIDINNKKYSINSQGIIIQTKNILDFAIKGEGYFKTIDEKNNQIFYTRCGSFKINPERYIITQEGYYLYPKTQISVNNNEQLTKLDNKTIKFYKSTSTKDNIEYLIKLYILTSEIIERNNQYFKFDKVEEVSNFEIIQGSLEQSNVPIYQTIGRMYFILSQFKTENKNNIEVKLFFLDKMLSSIDENYILKKINYHLSKIYDNFESFIKSKDILDNEIQIDLKVDPTIIPIIDSLIDYVKIDYK